MAIVKYYDKSNQYNPNLTKEEINRIINELDSKYSEFTRELASLRQLYNETNNVQLKLQYQEEIAAFEIKRRQILKDKNELLTREEIFNKKEEEEVKVKTLQDNSDKIKQYNPPPLKYPYEELYYSSADVVFTFDGGIFDDIITFQWALNNSKSPLFGYMSEDPDGVARGTRIVQGQFAVAMNDAYKLNKLLGSVEPAMDKYEYVKMYDRFNRIDSNVNFILDEWIGKGFDITLYFGDWAGNNRWDNTSIDSWDGRGQYRGGTKLELSNCKITNISQYIDANDATQIMLVYAFFGSFGKSKNKNVSVSHISSQEDSVSKSKIEPEIKVMNFIVSDRTANDILKLSTDNILVSISADIDGTSPFTIPGKVNENLTNIVAKLDKINVDTSLKKYDVFYDAKSAENNYDSPNTYVFKFTLKPEATEEDIKAFNEIKELYKNELITGQTQGEYMSGNKVGTKQSQYMIKTRKNRWFWYMNNNSDEGFMKWFNENCSTLNPDI